ncbi:MAG: hypothetical protein HY738_06410 [Bacteroidia bacterium]|nr:hypothetical protein [Bacteroidia bacterium]
MKCIKLFLFIILPLSLLFIGCKSDTQSTTDLVQDTLMSDVDEDIDIPANTIIKVPSPVELYLFMVEAKAPFNKEAMNPIENAKRYFTRASKSINLGIFASDLAYCTVFSRNQETFSYFSTAKGMADEMGLTEGFDEKIAKRINDNINKADSLYNITSSSYEAMTSYLENQKEGNILPFIFSGAWVESVHLAISSIDKFSENSELVQRVAEQRFVLQNILEYFRSIQKTEDMKKLEKGLKDIQICFDKLDNNIDVIITKEQFEEIKTKVEQIRKEFIS